MTIGAALFTIAADAVLAFAVTAELAGVDLQIVSYILLAIGVLGLLIGCGGCQPAALGRAAATVLRRTGRTFVLFLTGPTVRRPPVDEARRAWWQRRRPT